MTKVWTRYPSTDIDDDCVDTARPGTSQAATPAPLGEAPVEGVTGAFDAIDVTLEESDVARSAGWATLVEGVGFAETAGPAPVVVTEVPPLTGEPAEHALATTSATPMTKVARVLDELHKFNQSPGKTNRMS